MQETTTIGQYLLTTIKNLGIQTVYGIPGDFIINFFKQIEQDSALKLITLSHEPAVGFAAIGASRATQKPQVACVTYGPGALNMVNAVACAYSERVPLIVIAGGPPMNVRESGFLVHHTVKGSATQRGVYSEVTAKAVVLDNPKTVASLVAEVLAVCLERILPVYIEVPADMAEAAMVVPQFGTKPNLLSKGQSEEASAFVRDRFVDAAKPVFMYGVEAVRYGLVDAIVDVARQLNVPVVSTMLARDYTPKAENYFGVYLGDAGAAEAKALVDQSDFVLMLGEDVSDVNFGMKTATTRSIEIVRCVLSKVKTVQRTFEGVPLSDLVAQLRQAQPKTKWYNLPATTVQAQAAQTSHNITTDGIIDTLNRFFAEQGEMPTISDTGELLFATLRLQAQSIIGASFYGTMGLAVPAAIGYAVASKKRPLVLVGDGAFQMTGQEICHCPTLEINPIFVVSNNRVWGMEQQFHPSPINSLVDWQYAKLAELWGGKSYTCKTTKELWEALTDAKNQKTFSLIEVHTDESAPPEPLAKYVSEQKRA
ncbi:MAG TPA: thiamine pyrophosphate-binding protein [Candidatus Acidoferrales bacterium]|nr:thiamine pyrophosphate-binding protein [Candidatus Acidoferrales bacterium]